MRLKQLLSILLTLCMLMSTWVVSVSAETPSTVIWLNNQDLKITPSGYELDGITTPFTGRYIIGGRSNQTITFDEGSYQVTFHSFTCDPNENYEYPIYMNGNVVLDMTVIGINTFYCGKNPVIYGYGYNPIIRLTMSENSSLFMDAEHYVAVPPYNTFTMADGSAIPNESTDTGIYQVTDGTPVAHTATIQKGTADTCVFACEHCDSFDGISAAHHYSTSGQYISDTVCQKTCSVCSQPHHGNHTFAGYRSIDDATCGEYCASCDEVYNTNHNHSLSYKEKDDGHVQYCSDCNREFSEVLPHNSSSTWKDAETCETYCSDCNTLLASGTHSYENGSYTSVNNDYCVPVCDQCYGNAYNTSMEPDESVLMAHDFSAYSIYDNESCVPVCSRCYWWQEDENGNYVTVSHQFENETPTAATKDQPAHKEATCKLCHYTAAIYDPATYIVIDMPYNHDNANEMGGVLVYRNGVLWEHISNAEQTGTYALAYDKDSSYVFKLINSGCPETALTISVPGEEDPIFHSDDLYADGYTMYQTLVSYNVADYSGVQAAMDKIPDDVSKYTQQSVTSLVHAIQRVQPMLPVSQQEDVDAMADEIDIWVEALVPNADQSSHGIIHFTGNNCITITEDGYAVGSDVVAPTDVSPANTEHYTIFGSVVDHTGQSVYPDGYITVDCDAVINLVNVVAVGDGVGLRLTNEAAVHVDTFGVNGFVNTDSDTDRPYAGIEVLKGTSLSMNGNTDTPGSLVAVGQSNCAGIGGNDVEGQKDAGDISIFGGTVFALSTDDGAGIGGGYKGGAGKITISNGTVYAACLHNDGAGIGCGDDGNGGSVTINGGHVTALSLDDDGAGIGGADGGSIDAITINGGTVIAGSDDGAAIGGGQDSDSFGGKITINGGIVKAHKDHDEDENLLGNGNSDSKDADQTNYVEINGGNILTDGSNGIDPAPVNSDGVSVSPVNIEVPEGKDDRIFVIYLSNEKTVNATAYGQQLTIYLPQGVTVTAIAQLLTPGDLNDDGSANAVDALMVLKYAVGKEELNDVQKNVADVDIDDKINAVDALYILKVSVGLLDHFPCEQPID